MSKFPIIAWLAIVSSWFPLLESPLTVLHTIKDKGHYIYCSKNSFSCTLWERAWSWHLFTDIALSLFLSWFLRSLSLSLPLIFPPPHKTADAGRNDHLTSLFAQLAIHHTYSSHWYCRHTNTAHTCHHMCFSAPPHTGEGQLVNGVFFVFLQPALNFWLILLSVISYFKTSHYKTHKTAKISLHTSLIIFPIFTFLISFLFKEWLVYTDYLWK